MTTRLKVECSYCGEDQPITFDQITDIMKNPNKTIINCPNCGGPLSHAVIISILEGKI